MYYCEDCRSGHHWPDSNGPFTVQQCDICKEIKQCYSLAVKNIAHYVRYGFCGPLKPVRCPKCGYENMWLVKDGIRQVVSIYECPNCYFKIPVPNDTTTAYEGEII